MTQAQRTLVLVNCYDFNRRCLRSDLPPEQHAPWIGVAATYGDVAVHWVAGDRLIVTPKPLHPAMVVARAGGSVEVLCPQDTGAGLCRSLLADAEAVARILHWASQTGAPLHVTAWGATPEVYPIIQLLRERSGRVVTCDLVAPESYWVCSQLDAKSSLRALAAQAQLDMAPGWVCHDLAEAAEIAAAQMRNGHGVHVKSNLGVSGVGVYRIRHAPSDASPVAVEAELRRHWASLPFPEHGPFVVERSIPDTAGAVFANGQITDDGIILLGGGCERRDANNLYVGATISGVPHSEVLDPFRRLLSLAAAIGFRGEIGADFLIDGEGGAKLLEVNPRRCGESHAYMLAKQSFGLAWGQGLGVALTRLPLRVSPGEMNVDRILAAFDACNRECVGVGEAIPGALGWLDLPKPGLGYVVLASETKAAERVETRLHTELHAAGLQFN